MKKLLLILFLGFSLLAAGCAEKRTEESKQKEINICSSLGERMTLTLTRDFQKRYNIKANISYLPSGDFKHRQRFMELNKGDVWLGGTAEEYFLANRASLLIPYQAKEAYKIPADMRSKQGEWTSLYLGYIAFISNRNNLKELGLYAPTKWEDLLEPELRNEITIPDPQLGGASFGMLTSIWQLRGKEKALAYASNLGELNPVYTKYMSECIDQVYSGRKTIGVVPLDLALILEEKHEHLFATVVKDANRNLITGVAMLKFGRNEAEAKQFIDYLISDGGQKALQANGYRNLWPVKNYPFNDGRKELTGNIQVPTDDLAWTSTYKGEIIRQWMEASEKHPIK